MSQDSGGLMAADIGGTLDYDQYQQRRHIRALDGIRAVSILLVFTAHVGYSHFWPAFHGGTGVTIFFILSGYLITTLSLREESERGSLDIRAFYVRRVFRIYPLFLAVLAFYTALIVGLGFQSDRRADFLANLPYMALFFPEHAILDPDAHVPFSLAWSLGVEEKFYFVWPLVGFVLLAAAFRRRLAFLAMVAVVAAAFSFEFGRAVGGYVHIALGCILAILLHREDTYGRLRHLGRPLVLAMLGAAFVALQFGTSAVADTGSLYVPYGLLVTAILGGVVVTASRADGWLRSRPLVFLGRISYAFYLLHGFAINGVELALKPHTLPVSLLSSAIALMVAVAMAWVAHVLLERPMIRLGHRVSDRLERRRAVAQVGQPSAMNG